MQQRVIIVLLLMISFSLISQTTLAEKHTIIIGGDHDFPPYEFVSKEGEPKGYNVDLSKAIAQTMGYDIKFRLGKWSKVKEWLLKGEIDIVQGMAYSSERAKIYEFSFPHTKTWRCIFVRTDSQFKKGSDLIKSKIVLQEGDVAEEYLKSINFKGNIIYAPTQEEALRMLAEGNCDACLINYMHGMYIIDNQKIKDVKPLVAPFDPKFYCFAAKKPNQLLVNDVNVALNILQQTGKIKEIQDKWFGKYNFEEQKQRTLIHRMMMIIIPLLFILILSLYGLWILRKRIIQKQKELQTELEDKLRYESELNREYKMFVNGPVIVYKLLDDLKTISYISDNIRQFGYDPKDIILHKINYQDIIFSEDWPKVKELLSRDLEDENEFAAKQYRVLTANGNICWVFDYCMVVKELHQKSWFYGYMLDITAQKSLEAELLEAKEKAETANIAKGHFLANISHEIRTPLNGIIGFIQVLRNMPMSPEQKEYLELIHTSGKNLMKIVNDILDFSKMESGKLDLIVTDFNPRFLVEDIIKNYSNTNTKRMVDLRYRVSDQLPTIVYGDMMRLRQILINLMQNALKFTEKGYVEITADVYSQFDDDIRLLFSVRDTGIGIDPVKQRDIFDNFIQADASITRKYGGTGLGLSIVKKLVELMGGFIWVESEQFKGSSFFFIIPFRTRLADQPRFEQQLEEELKEKPPLPKMKILIVEDEPINQLVTKKQLERWHQEVTIANNGQEAVDLIKNKDFDCILMDVQMPVLDGISATTIIREREKESGKHVTIIAFTAAAMSGDKERFLAAGMDDYLAKPIDVDRLYNILKNIATFSSK